MDLNFYLQAIFLGVGLAMDACAVSMTNGLNNPKIGVKGILLIALMFAIFQGAMPLAGYFVGHGFLKYIEKFIPWIALVLLLFLGINMIINGIKNEQKENVCGLTLKIIFVQAIATSIDALSVGFTFANYLIIEAVITVLFITIITFLICYVAVNIGKRFGAKLGSKAVILGGIILILIGINIFVRGMWF